MVLLALVLFFCVMATVKQVNDSSLILCVLCDIGNKMVCLVGKSFGVKF